MKSTKKSQLERFEAKWGKSKVAEEIIQEAKEQEKRTNSTMEAQAAKLIKHTNANISMEEVGAVFTYQGMSIMMDWVQQANTLAIKQLEESMNNKIAEMEARISAKYEAILEEKIQQFTNGMLVGMNKFMQTNLVSGTVQATTTPETPATETPAIKEVAISTPQENVCDDIPRTPTGNIQWGKDIAEQQRIFNYYLNLAKEQGWDGKSKMAFAALGKDYGACYQKASRAKLDWHTEE